MANVKKIAKSSAENFETISGGGKNFFARFKKMLRDPDFRRKLVGSSLGLLGFGVLTVSAAAMSSGISPAGALIPVGIVSMGLGKSILNEPDQAQRDENARKEKEAAKQRREYWREVVRREAQERASAGEGGPKKEKTEAPKAAPRKKVKRKDDDFHLVDMITFGGIPIFVSDEYEEMMEDENTIDGKYSGKKKSGYSR